MSRIFRAYSQSVIPELNTRKGLRSRAARSFKYELSLRSSIVCPFQSSSWPRISMANFHGPALKASPLTRSR